MYKVVIFLNIILIGIYLYTSLYYYSDKSIYFHIAKTAGLLSSIFFIFLLFKKYILLYHYFNFKKIHYLIYSYIILFIYLHVLFHILNNSIKRYISGSILIILFGLIPFIYYIRRNNKYHRFYWIHKLIIYKIWILMTYHSWKIKFGNSQIILLTGFLIYHLIMFIELSNKKTNVKLIKFDTFVFLPVNNKCNIDNTIYITIPEISYESHPFCLSKMGDTNGVYIKSSGNWCNKLRNNDNDKLSIYWNGYYKSYSKKVEKTILYEKCLLIISGLHFTTITFLLNKTVNKNLSIIFITNSLHEMYVMKSLINIENIHIYITKNIDKNEKEMLKLKITNKRPDFENIIEYYSLIEEKTNIICFTNKKIKKNIKNIIKNFNNIKLIS